MISAGLSLCILVPLCAAALSFSFPRAARKFALVSALLSTVGIVVLANQVISSGVLRHQVGGWPAPLGIELRADGLAVWFLVIAAIVAVAITLYTPSYFAQHHDEATTEPSVHSDYFWPLFLFLWAALNALFLSADVFNLYVTLELLGFAAVMLVALEGRRAAVNAAMRYFFVSLSGSLFYLMGVAIFYGSYSTVDLQLLAGVLRSEPPTWIALALITGGLLMKSALFPLHVWLPPAHANAAAPVSALLSALVVKGAIYILLRIWFEASPHALPDYAPYVLGLFGAAAILWGSTLGLIQARLKMLIAYSTVAQLGYIFLLFPLAWPESGGYTAWSGGLILLAAHACAKTAMFLAAGNIMVAAGHDRIRDLDGITHVLPVTIFAFALAGVSLIGIPPSGGFVGKWLLLNAALHDGQWFWVVVIVIGGLLATAYVMRVLSHAFTRVEEPRVPNPVPPVMEWTAFAMALLAVLLGFVGDWPAALLRHGAPVAGPFLFGGAGQ